MADFGRVVRARWSPTLVWSYTASVTHHRIARTVLFTAALGFTSVAYAETAKPPLAPEASSTQSKAASPPAKPAPAGASSELKSTAAKVPELAVLRQGVVIVEQLKRPVAVGIVLAGDGRILTALSPIGAGNSLTARYANGATKRLRVASSHRGMNLALLSPEDSRFTEGLRASRMLADDASAQARWLRGNQTGPGIVAPAGKVRKETLTGGDDYTLRDVFTFGFVPRPFELGSALVDVNGDVLGIISQACQSQPNGDCRLIAYAVPASMIKEFLEECPCYRCFTSALDWASSSRR